MSKDVTKSVEKMAASANSALAELGGGAIAGLSVAGLIKLGDEYNSVENRIIAATRASGDFAVVNDKIFQISQKTGSALEDTASLFQGIARVGPEIGATQQDIFSVVQEIQQLGVISGASGTAMKNGITQFTQAVASGKVGAQDMRAVIEDVPEIANRIAKGLGTTTASLRAMINDGKLQGKDLFNALLSQAADVDTQFGSVNQGLEQGFNRIKNSVEAFLGSFEKVIPIQTAIKKVLDEVAKSTDGATLALKNWLAEHDKLDPTNEQKIGAMWQVIGGGIKLATNELQRQFDVATQIPSMLSKLARQAPITNEDVDGADEDKMFGQWSKNIQDVSKQYTDLQKKYDGVAQDIKAQTTINVLGAMKSVSAQAKKTGDDQVTAYEKADKKAASLAARQAEMFRKATEQLEKQNDVLRLTVTGHESDIQLVQTLDNLHKQMNRDLTVQEQATVRLLVAENQRLTQTKQLQDFIRAEKERNATLQAELTGTTAVASATAQLSKLRLDLAKNGKLSADNAKLYAQAEGEVNRQLSLQLQLQNQQMREQENQQGAQLFDQTRTAAEKYKLTLTNLNVLVGKGVIDQDTYARSVASAVTEFNQASPATQAWADQLSRVNEVMQGLITEQTPLRNFMVTLQTINQAKASGVYTDAQINSAMKQLGKNTLQTTNSYSQLSQALRTYKQNVDALKAAQQANTIDQKQFNLAVGQNKLQLLSSIPAVQELGGAFTDAFTNAVTGAESFGQAAGDVMKAIEKLIIKAMILSTIGLLWRGITGGIGGITSIFSSLSSFGKFFGPALNGSIPGLATGGPISGPAVVGERGPELFIPDGPGTIVPNDVAFGGNSSSGNSQSGGGGTQLVVNVSNNMEDADVSIAQDPDDARRAHVFINRSVASGARSNGPVGQLLNQAGLQVLTVPR